MSIYYNNPRLTCPMSVDISLDSGIVDCCVKSVVKAIVPDPWSDLNDDDITVTTLTGGITNALYLVKHEINDIEVLVRVFGQGTEDIIDRNIENVVFSSLSGIEHFKTPKFFGLFENGRVEEFIRDSVTLTPENLSEAPYFSVIAEVLASFATVHLDISKENILWRTIEKFFQLASCELDVQDVLFGVSFIHVDLQMMRLNHTDLT